MLQASLEEIFPNIPKDIDISELDIDNIPVHVACIMDGNGRWAKSRGKIRLQGHKAGVESVREVIRTASALGVKFLTMYSFSTENWSRPKDEVNGLMDLFTKSIFSEMDELHKNNVKMQILGDISALPQKTRNAFKIAVDKMENNTGMVLMPAINYGSRKEILRAISLFNKENLNNKKKLLEGPTETELSNYMYTKNVSDPDLLIRTSGENRISNFLLWQIAYSEIYVTDVLWPEFDRYEFLKSIIAYQKRNRRYGGI